MIKLFSVFFFDLTMESPNNTMILEFINVMDDT